MLGIPFLSNLHLSSHSFLTVFALFGTPEFKLYKLPHRSINLLKYQILNYSLHLLVNLNFGSISIQVLYFPKIFLICTFLCEGSSFKQVYQIIGFCIFIEIWRFEFKKTFAFPLFQYFWRFFIYYFFCSEFNQFRVSLTKLLNILNFSIILFSA